MRSHVKEALFLFLLIFTCVNGQTIVSTWITSADKTLLLTPQKNTNFQQCRDEDASYSIHVDKFLQHQKALGFGAAVTESSAYVYAQLKAAYPSVAYDLMQSLFGNDEKSDNIGISVVRVPLGACDFSLDDFTFDDTPLDFALSNFTISRDEDYIIPFLQDALQINPDIRIISSPWTPPVWMKTTGAWGNGTLLPQMHETYANYFVKYIQQYNEHGIDIFAVTIQNEPLFQPQTYPGMLLHPQEAAAFINVLKPKMQQAGLSTQILVFDHNWDLSYYPVEVLHDQSARLNSDGIAFHCYGGQVTAQSAVHMKFPEKSIHLTECTGTETETVDTFGGNILWNAQNLFIGGLENFAESVVFWNIILDPNYGPTNHGCMDCRAVVTVNYQTGEITKNSEYYILGQAGKFIQRGAVRLQTKITPAGNGPVIATSFLNQDESTTILAANMDDKNATVMINYDGKCFDYVVPSGVATFVLK